MALQLVPPGQRKGNTSYLARGRVNGRIEERSLQTADEKIARRRLRELESQLQAAKADDRVTFAEAARRYVEFRSPSRDDRRRIDRVVQAIGTHRLRDIRPADLHSLSARLYGDRAARATQNREVLRPAVTVLHYAADAGLCDWIRVRAFKEPRPVTRALDPEAAAALVLAAPAGPKRLLLTWLFFQGTRISTTLALDWSQIDIDRRVVRMHNRKGDRSEEFPLHAAVLRELELSQTREGRLFPWSNRSSLRRWLPKLAASVGVEFTPHMARHTLGSMLAANGATLKAIMGALGHSTASSSLRYQSGDVEMVRAATAAIELPHAKKVGNAA